MNYGTVRRCAAVLICTAAVALTPASPVYPAPVDQSTYTAPMNMAAGGASADIDYALGVADKVRVIVFDEPSLSGEFIVNANGSLSMPLIGDVRAIGNTASDIAQTIQTKLREGYVLEPRVSIDILTFRPFYILGEVNKPGEYPYSSGLTVDGAVATAQGYTYRAEKKSVYIKRAADARAIKMKLTTDLRIRPGDTIRVGERYL